MPTFGAMLRLRSQALFFEVTTEQDGPALQAVILSGAGTSRSEDQAESKDPYICSCRLGPVREFLCAAVCHWGRLLLLAASRAVSWETDTPWPRQNR